MRFTIIPALAAALLAGCGGGGSNGGSAGSASTTLGATAGANAGGSPAAASDTFANANGSPKQGAQLVFKQTLVDNLNNTYERTVDETLSVNADGSFVAHDDDPAHAHIVSGKTDLSLYPTDYQYDAAGKETGYVITRPAGAVHCSFTPGGTSGSNALKVGNSWSDSYTLACDGGEGVVYTRSTSVAAVDTVTVAAGTFSAYRIQQTISHTNNGLTRTDTVTRWYNTDRSGPHTVRIAAQYSYSGATPPAGALTSLTSELQSYH